MTIMGIQWLAHNENVRSNKMRENISLQTLGETHRTNVVNEGIKQGSLDESVRANKARESISYATLDESIRHNKVSENLGFATLNETSRANRTREAENQRTNQANEQIKTYAADLNVLLKTAPGYATTSTQTYKRMGTADQTMLQVMGGITNASKSLNDIIPNFFE